MSLKERRITKKEAAEFERFAIFPPLDADELLKSRLGSIPTGHVNLLLNYPQSLHQEISTIADYETLSVAHILRSFVALRIRIDHQKTQALQLGLPSHITVLGAPLDSETLLANYALNPKHGCLLTLSRRLRAIAGTFAKERGQAFTPYLIQAAALGVGIYRPNREADPITTLPLSYEIADRGYASSI